MTTENPWLNIILQRCLNTKFTGTLFPLTISYEEMPLDDKNTQYVIWYLIDEKLDIKTFVEILEGIFSEYLLEGLVITATDTKQKLFFEYGERNTYYIITIKYPNEKKQTIINNHKTMSKIKQEWKD